MTLKLTQEEQKALHDALHYMSVAELKECCNVLALNNSGNKSTLIERITTFALTGTIPSIPTIPPISRAKHHETQALHPQSLMLHGNYKNDARTRAFFKSIIGEYFHFTAFGIDWLNEQWLKGTPPTYQEFARYWVQEYETRKRTKPIPKQEWAYINFLQDAQKSMPHACKDELMATWHQTRKEKILLAYKLLNIK
jgi:hypothetical protein